MDTAVELSLLGACLSASFALPATIDEGVSAADFALPSHGAIWRAMLAVQAELGIGESVDPLLVGARLNGQLDEVGGTSYLHSLVTACPSYSNARQYAREVLDASLKRKVRKILTDLEQAQGSGAELLEELQIRAFGLERRPREAKTMAAAFEELFHETEHPTVSVCSYPWRPVEYCTRGLRPGWLTYLAGEPKMGKTAAALEITDYVLSAGKSVLFLSLEMSAFEIAVRLAQRNGFRSDVLYGHGSPKDSDFDALLKLIGQEKWKRLRIESVDNVAQIGSVIRRVSPDLVILDYLQLLDIGKDQRTEGTTKNSNALKRLARRHAVPIIALSQLSRAAREDHGKKPRLSRLRDSGALEQDADAVIFVWRKRAEDGEAKLPEGCFIVAAARHGTEGMVDFYFDRDRQTFTLVDNQHSDPFGGQA
jgi:replicative DNA helicase